MAEKLPVLVADLWAWMQECYRSSSAALQRNNVAAWNNCSLWAAVLPPGSVGGWLLFWQSRNNLLGFFLKGLSEISKSLFCLCQYNLSLLITVVCHLAVFNVWGVLSSNTPVGNWGHGEKEQLVQDHTAGNWQQETEAKSQAVFAEQG